MEWNFIPKENQGKERRYSSCMIYAFGLQPSETYTLEMRMSRMPKYGIFQIFNIAKGYSSLITAGIDIRPEETEEKLVFKAICSYIMRFFISIDTCYFELNSITKFHVRKIMCYGNLISKSCSEWQYHVF